MDRLSDPHLPPLVYLYCIVCILYYTVLQASVPLRVSSPVPVQLYFEYASESSCIRSESNLIKPVQFQLDISQTNPVPVGLHNKTSWDYLESTYSDSRRMM